MRFVIFFGTRERNKCMVYIERNKKPLSPCTVLASLFVPVGEDSCCSVVVKAIEGFFTLLSFFRFFFRFFARRKLLSADMTESILLHEIQRNQHKFVGHTTLNQWHPNDKHPLNQRKEA